MTPRWLGPEDWQEHHDALDLFDTVEIRPGSAEEPQIVVVVDDRVVGALTGSFIEDATFSVAVHPEYRRRGIASMLIQSWLENLEDLDIESTSAFVINPNLVPLLVRLGFEWWEGPYWRYEP